MAQQTRTLVAKPDNLSSIPGVWWKERIHSHKLFSDLHMHSKAPHTKQNVIKFFKN